MGASSMSKDIMSWQDIGDLIKSHKLSGQALKNRDEVAQLVRIQLKEISSEIPRNSDIGVLLLIMGESLLEAVDND
jgi:hypothetical protein